MKKAIVGFSGGVDSSVAAYILKKEGFEVIAVTLKFFSQARLEPAKNIAQSLGIEWRYFDCSKEFEKFVVDYFYQSYKNARTPNPCIFCNRYVKFKFLTEKLKSLDSDIVATGHYANTKEISGIKLISKAKAVKKDQSYFLSFLSKEQIEKVAFPIGRFKSKEEVRTLAKNIGLSNYLKKDSLDICFIQGDYRNILKEKLKGYGKGYFIYEGEILKEHGGIYNYTIGQRKGIKINHKEPLYIGKIDPINFNITLVTKNLIYKKYVFASLDNPLYIPSKKFRAKAKLRSAMEEKPCTVKIKDKYFVIEFDDLIFAPANGQIATVYLDNAIILSGQIAGSK